MAKTVREVQCLYVGGSGVVAVVVLVVWWSWRWWWWRRQCGVAAGATSVYMRACVGGTRTSPGPWFSLARLPRLVLSFSRTPLFTAAALSVAPTEAIVPNATEPGQALRKMAVCR